MGSKTRGSEEKYLSQTMVWLQARGMLGQDIKENFKICMRLSVDYTEMRKTDSLIQK